MRPESVSVCFRGRTMWRHNASRHCATRDVQRQGPTLQSRPMWPAHRHHNKGVSRANANTHWRFPGDSPQGPLRGGDGESDARAALRDTRRAKSGSAWRQESRSAAFGPPPRDAYATFVLHRHNMGDPELPMTEPRGQLVCSTPHVETEVNLLLVLGCTCRSPAEAPLAVHGPTTSTWRTLS